MIVYVVHAGASVCILIIHTYSITQNAKIINLFIVLSQIHIVEFPAFISDTSNREFPPGSLKAKFDGKTFMNFKIGYSNQAGNCTLIVSTDYQDTEPMLSQKYEPFQS